VRYLIKRTHRGKDRYYWAPKKEYVLDGKITPCPYRITRLKGDILAHAGRLNDMLDTWLETSEPVTKFFHGTVGWMVGEYKRDPRFTELADSTRKLYETMLPQICDELGDFPIVSVTRPMARDFCLSFGEHSRKPSAMGALCRLIFNFGKAIDAVTANPFDSLRIPKPKPRRNMWTQAQITATQAKAVPSIALAFQMGLDTLQRPGDLMRLAWTAYDGQWLRVRQSKTGAVVDIPVFKFPALKKMMDETPRVSPIMLIDERTGKPYTKERFTEQVRAACELGAIPKELQFRDLRRTGIVRLGEHGATNAEIAALSGHSLDETQKILEVYLPRTRKMAENAVVKLNKNSPAGERS
jgi:integrase